jgi:hypothetical protein
MFERRIVVQVLVALGIRTCSSQRPVAIECENLVYKLQATFAPL